MSQQVLDDVIMTSRDISEKRTSQNAMDMKLGQQVLGKEKIRMSMSQQILGDVIMTSSDIFKKTILPEMLWT